MKILNINQQNKRIEVKSFEIQNEIVFNYFNNLPEAERDERLLKAIYIGVLALMEDRISAFLAKTSNELGTELESLKMIFEMKKELFYKTAVKGIFAEREIVDFLNEYFSNKKMKDRAILTGNLSGNLLKNKTGDIVCEIGGNSETKIAIECKFDKSIRLGDIASKEIFGNKSDTAWSQLLEAQVNRGTIISIIVFDRALVDNSITRNIDNVIFIRGIGFISIVDSQRGDFSNLLIAYMLARDIVLNAKQFEIDTDILNLIISRIIKDISEVMCIKSLVETNIETNKTILKQLEKSILLMQFNQEYLLKFLKDGKLNQKDLLDFYLGDEVKEKYKILEKEMITKFYEVQDE
jgi:hypothetical protein